MKKRRINAKAEAVRLLRWLSVNVSNEYEAFACRCAELELVTGCALSTTDLVVSAILQGHQTPSQIGKLTRLPPDRIAQTLAGLQQAGYVVGCDEIRDDDEVSFWLRGSCAKGGDDSYLAIPISASNAILLE